MTKSTLDALIVSDTSELVKYTQDVLSEGVLCISHPSADVMSYLESRAQPHLVVLDWRCEAAQPLVEWCASRKMLRCFVWLDDANPDSLGPPLAGLCDEWDWWSSTTQTPARSDASLRLLQFVRRYREFLTSYHWGLKLAKAVSLTSDGIEITDPSIVWEHLNPAFLAITGYSYEESLGKTPKQMIMSGLHDASHYEGIFAATEKGEVWQGGHIGRRKDHTLSFQENSIARVFDDRGENIGFVGLKRDLFHSRFMNEKAASGNVLRDWIEEATDGLLLFDEDERLIDANMTACHQLGYSLSELTQLPISTFDIQYEKGLIASYFEDRKIGESFTHGTWFRRKNGSTFAALLEQSVLPMGSAHFLAVSIKDVTELKQAQSQLEQLNQELSETKNAAIEANHAKSLFLANMSHELRTPLNAVIGYSQLIKEELEDEGHVEYVPDLQKIDKSASHLLGLINNVLDLSKIEANKLDLVMEAVNLVELITETEHTIASAVEKQQNTFTCRFETGIEFVEADRLRLRQILLNLLGNACKFTNGGCIELIVREEREAGQLLFEVKDNGIGIAPALQELLFEPFTQLHKRTGVVKLRGTGLGLAISRRLCRAMGGDLVAKSALGEGSSFIVSLPLSRT